MANTPTNDSPLTDSPYGYWLAFGLEVEDSPHQFCGENLIDGANCPACKKPLLRLLSLKANDARLHLGHPEFPFIHLLYCWTCSIPFGHFVYQMQRTGGVELLSWESDYQWAFGTDGPYEGYTGLFPGQAVGLICISEEENRKMQLYVEKGIESPVEGDRYLYGPRHQIGGSPLIFNAEGSIRCLLCEAEIPLLAAISDDAGPLTSTKSSVDKTFTGNYGTQMIFHYCRSCAVVSAYHSND